jgi:hypothetical protein
VLIERDETVKLNDCLKNLNLKSYIAEQNQDLWVNTDFEGYKLLGNKQKGQIGEKIIEELFRFLGCKVENPLNTGHDSIVNKFKLEMKFSLAQSDYKKMKIIPNKWMMNHVAVGKDWDWLCFCGKNPEGTDDIIKMMSKENFSKIIKDEWHIVDKGGAKGKLRNKYFSPQQGGNKADNDDWMCGDKKLISLLNSEYTIGLDEWLKIYG